MLFTNLSFLLLWLALAFFATILLDKVTRLRSEHMPWSLKVGFSAFSTLFLLAIILAPA